jgi:hypothetical protein
MKCEITPVTEKQQILLDGLKGRLCVTVLIDTAHISLTTNLTHI